MSEQTVLAALIVRNIGDIEAAINMASDLLDKQFFKEVVQAAAQRATDTPWHVQYDEDKWEIKLTRNEWITNNEDDFWLQFSELPGPNEESDTTWIAVATRTGPNGATLGLSFQHRPITPARLRILLNNHPPLVTSLSERGFKRDESGRQLFIPVTIDREELAQAFENDDFDTALEPIRVVVTTVQEAEQKLDELVRLIRGQAIP
jgi:hypothetical protein